MKKVLSLLLLSVLVIALSGCKPKDEILFDLILGEEINLSVGDIWYEPGYIIKKEQEDLSEYLVITGDTVDTSIEGVYIITYTLDYEGKVIEKTRTVTVGSFNTNCSVYQYRDDDNELIDSDKIACNIVWNTYLDTVVKLSIFLPIGTEINTNPIFEEVEETLAYYNIMSDKYKEYSGVMNVYAINQDPATTHTLDQDLFNLIKFTFDHQPDVNNLFNASLGPVLQIWHDYRENCTNTIVCEVPTMAELQEANQYTDPSKVVLDSENLTITMEENMSLDLGGVSKGFISKQIIDYLDTLNLSGYLLNNGESNISIGGVHPIRENGKFTIAAKDPNAPSWSNDYYALIYLGDGEQLVTSGDYQKFYTVGDTTYHHIINPNTLFPDNNSRSVSIITSDPGLADLYSTAIFNMTVTEGQAFVNGIDGLEAIWYGIDDKIYFSENFEEDHLLSLNN